MRTLAPILLCLSLGTALAADKVSKDFLRHFNQTVRKAEALIKSDQPKAAIAVFEEALVSDLAGFGRVHLHLAQLHASLKNTTEAAKHFRYCTLDERVDTFDREYLCADGFNQVTAILDLVDLPPDATVAVRAPKSFAGPFTSGSRLPLGAVTVVVESPQHHPRETVLTLTGPLKWEAAMGLRKAKIIPDDFVTAPEDPVGPDAEGPLRWPAYTAAGVGLALVGSGIAFGRSNQEAWERIQQNSVCAPSCRSKQTVRKQNAQIADSLWIGGATVAASSILFWYLFDEDVPATKETP